MTVFSSFVFGQSRFVRPPFVFYYSGADSQQVIPSLESALKARLPALEEALGVRMPVPAHIYVTLSRSEFYQYTRGGVPNWAGGIAYPQRKLIVVKHPLFFGQGVPLETLTAHEITHLLTHRATRDNYLPRWLDEGLSVVLSGENRAGSFARLGRAALADRLIGLPRVDQVLRLSSPEADLAYSEAQSAAAYLIDRHRMPAVRDLLRRVGEGQDFDEAFYLATGVGYEAWQVEWMQYARLRYRWFALMDLDNLIWIVILLLVLIAGTTVWIRRRRQMKQLERMEEEDWQRWGEWETPYNNESHEEETDEEDKKW